MNLHMQFKEITRAAEGGILCLVFLLAGIWGCASVKSHPSTVAKTPITTSQNPAPIPEVIKKTPSPEAKGSEETQKPNRQASLSDFDHRVSVTLYPTHKTVASVIPPLEETLPPPKICQPEQEKKQKGKKPLFDIPIVMNPLVENFIHYYQTTGRKQFSIWLARSERYIPMMRKVLKKEGLPTDLVYLAMIESGFNPVAYSNRRASGPWQFIPCTGRKYGLKVNYWIDERRDPEKSTIAAARYLKDLYDQFESWHLAAAAYNCGEGKLSRAIKRYKTEDYWQLIQHHYLKKETRMYVPQMIAAALIAKEPEKYGFTNIQYQEPLKYEQAVVPGGVPLREIAKACHCEEQTLRLLNPELIRRCTPPYAKHFVVKIPEGSKQILAMNMKMLRPIVKATPNGWIQTHVVRKGDTLYDIAMKYHVRVRDIRYLNHIRGNLLHIGQRLLIPSGRRHHKTYAMLRYPRRKISSKVKKVVSLKPTHHKRQASTRFREIIYVVRKGDNLWSIARTFNIHIKDICRLNPQIKRTTLLRPRDRLKLRVPMATLSGIPYVITSSLQ